MFQLDSALARLSVSIQPHLLSPSALAGLYSQKMHKKMRRLCQKHPSLADEKVISSKLVQQIDADKQVWLRQ
jgi:hypothetical protein